MNNPKAEPLAQPVRTLRTPPDLDLASRLLRAPIPTPPPPKPKPQRSWKGLPEGRHLELLVPYFDGTRQWPAGSKFEVTAPTNLGISLRPLLTGPNEGATLSTTDPITWSHPEWKATFKTARRAPARRKTRSSTKPTGTGS